MTAVPMQDHAVAVVPTFAVLDDLPGSENMDLNPSTAHRVARQDDPLDRTTVVADLQVAVLVVKTSAAEKGGR